MIKLLEKSEIYTINNEIKPYPSCGGRSHGSSEQNLLIEGPLGRWPVEQIVNRAPPTQLMV
jgi:hypothetical protein